MERFNALGRGAQLMLVGGVLLLIDLFLPWQDFDVGGIADELGVDASFSGWRGFRGVVLGLLTIVMLAWLIVRLASVDIPLPVSTAMTGALLGVLILIFAVIKILTILGDETTIWAWIGLALAIVIAVGAFQVVQEAGGVDQLRSEIPSMPPLRRSSPAERRPARRRRRLRRLPRLRPRRARRPRRRHRLPLHRRPSRRRRPSRAARKSAQRRHTRSLTELARRSTRARGEHRRRAWFALHPPQTRFSEYLEVSA